MDRASIADSFSLAGRVAVVTGAASGIGRAIAETFAAAGAALVLADIADDSLAETERRIVAAGGQASHRRTDVAHRDEIEALAAAALAAYGRLDIWVSSAGTIVNVPIVDAAEADFDRLIAVNLKSVYWGCAVAGRIMTEAGRGSIVNISSTGGESPNPGLSLYSMTKAAVNMVTRTAARELGPGGVRVNAIAPGWIDTPMGTHSFRDAAGAVDPERLAEGLKLRAGASPLGLTGTPDDVALAALYLAADASRFVTGQLLRPNGGVLM